MMPFPVRSSGLRSVSCLLAAGLLFGLAGPAQAKKQTPDQERADIQKMEKETLARLYKLNPGAKAAVEKAAGYAVFSNFGMKIFVTGGGSGKGVAVDRASGSRTYMKMVEVQAGLGVGIKKFSLVWVFGTKSALEQFKDSGWEVGGQATAAAKTADKGGAWAGAMSIAPEVWLYQMTKDGLALELTAKGTKYYKDKDLN